jgi:Xaa-Pro aminopeptidase
VDKLSAVLDGVGVDAILVTDLVNVRYLTGYTGSNGLAVIGIEKPVFVTDFRYVSQAAEEVDPAYEQIKAIQDLLEGLPEILPGGNLKLGFDDAHMSVKGHKRLAELLGERIELVPTAGVVEKLRAVKEPVEIEQIAKASKVADEALQAIFAKGLEGRREIDVARALASEMLERGASAPSFDAIVAAGPHGALPHAQPRDHQIAKGDMVVFDWGSLVGGYHSDCTRTIAVGEPGAQQREKYELVLSAQLAGLGAVTAGANGRDVDTIARDVIEGAGEGAHYGHGLGHGVGLEIHEAPRLSQRSEDTLVAGNVVTVEPGVYLPGELGIRIEDLVVVTDNAPRILTGLDKQLTICD